jgi:hypothetical protein
LVIKALDPEWIRINIQPKMLDPDEMNADPQPWLLLCDNTKKCHNEALVEREHVCLQQFKFA